MAESIKVRMLLASYPLYDKKVLEELLQSCGGSVEKTRLLLGANSATEKRKHQEIESNDKDVKRETPYTASTDNINDTISANVNGFTSPAKANSKYQSSITPMLKKTRTILSTNSLLIPETNNPKTIRIYTPQQVQEYLGTYVEMYKSFLPDDLASRVLDHLMLPEVKKGAKPAEFHLFDNDCVSLHSTLVAHSKRSPDELFLDRLVYNGKKRVSTMYNDDMEEASLLISKFLNQEVIPKNKRLPFQSLKPWDSHYTVINYYKDIQSHLDYHSDRLTHIGPHCYVVSLLLGSTRQFRMRKNYGKDAAIQYYLELPHNCLLVMKPGCQEEFRHSINAMKNAIQLHPKYGSERVNLTFRCYSDDFIMHIPVCKCNITMVLRRAFKTVQTRGKYFWSCENSYQNKDCGSFHWADFNNKEGNFIAQTEDDASLWIAKDDKEKLDWVQRRLTISKRTTRIKTTQTQAKSL